MLSQDITEIILIVLLMYETQQCLKKINARRRMWVRQLYLDRDKQGLFETSFLEMYDNDPEGFKRTVRMNKQMFDSLFNLVKRRLTKYSNRPSISGQLRLFVTLHYLAHGGSQHMFALSYKMAHSTVNKIILETCNALWNELGSNYLLNGEKSQMILRTCRVFQTVWVPLMGSISLCAAHLIQDRLL